MNIDYLIDNNGRTKSVVIQAGLWQKILECLEKSPESLDILKDIPKPPAILQETERNSLKALLDSDFIGCFESKPDLSVNYKPEINKILDSKYGNS